MEKLINQFTTWRALTWGKIKRVFRKISFSKSNQGHTEFK